ncbi:MAG: hypothetical protein HYX34_11475 [Actinobacteria bacterium]|nr:hypothetical protein [Actinomycetota bacterium]
MLTMVAAVLGGAGIAPLVAALPAGAAVTAMRVTPSTGLEDGQVVTVSGTAAPGESVQVGECTFSFDLQCASSASATAGPAGRWSTTLAVSDFVSYGTRLPDDGIHCRAEPGRCEIWATSGSLFDGPEQSVPLMFNGGPVTMSARYAGTVSGGQRIRVTGTVPGAAGRTAYLTTCIDVYIGYSCDAGAPRQAVPVAADGTVAGTYVMPIVDPSGEPCTVESCLIGLVPPTQGWNTPVARIPAVVRVEDLRVREGTGGTRSALVGVTLDRASSSPVRVRLSTADGTAVAPGDYSATEATVTVPAGSTAAVLAVPLVTDARPEPNETFLVAIRWIDGGVGYRYSTGRLRQAATVTIRNDDPASAS